MTIAINPAVDHLFVYLLADGFAAVLKSWATPDEWQTMRATNTGPEYRSGTACASHDFCDANMAMLEAFTDLIGCEMSLGDENAEQQEWDFTLVNAAWAYAKKTYLTEETS